MERAVNHNYIIGCGNEQLVAIFRADKHDDRDYWSSTCNCCTTESAVLVHLNRYGMLMDSAAKSSAISSVDKSCCHQCYAASFGVFIELSMVSITATACY